MAHDPSLDPSALDTLRELESEADPDLVKDLLGLFRREGPARIYRMRAALDQDDCAAAADIAHTFKSSAGTLGALRLQALCKQLEESARADDAGTSRELLAAVQAEYALVLELLPTA